MSGQTCILVFGIDETASAVARMLLLSGYSVAIHQPAPPATLRQKMAFADAWYDGASMLDGVQARRADLSSDSLCLLSTTYDNYSEPSPIQFPIR
jgi:xanthine dehydrogenase accessory factor